MVARASAHFHNATAQRLDRCEEPAPEPAHSSGVEQPSTERGHLERVRIQLHRHFSFGSRGRGLSSNGKPGRVYEKTNRNLRELRLATPQCIEAMLSVPPFTFAVAKGATRDMRVVRWDLGPAAGIFVPAVIPTPPTKKGHCEIACQTTVTDNMMSVVSDQVEEVMKYPEAFASSLGRPWQQSLQPGLSAFIRRLPRASMTLQARRALLGTRHRTCRVSPLDLFRRFRRSSTPSRLVSGARGQHRVLRSR